VGSFRPVKRPEALLDLARQLPDLRFALVGGHSAEMAGYFNRVAAAASSLPNLTVYGAVPYQQVGTLFDRAKLLVNTSTMEGFPNTFLQAWMRGVPVATTFDPDGIVRRQRLGVAATSPAELAPAIAAVVANQASRRTEAGRIRAYALQEFSAPAIARKYLDLLSG
jgi:glycosyltransferase involved in cell wall biosynthesis